VNWKRRGIGWYVLMRGDRPVASIQQSDYTEWESRVPCSAPILVETTLRRAKAAVANHVEQCEGKCGA